jgi:hypothetical protein
MKVVPAVMIVRLSVWLTLAVHHRLERVAPLAAQVLAHAVEDDDGVVDRVAGDGQDGRDDVERQFVAEEREEGQRDQDVVQRGGDRADREREPEADADVDGDADDGGQRGVDALALQVGADDRTDDLLADHLELAEVGLRHRVDDGASARSRLAPSSLVISGRRTSHSLAPASPNC